MAEQMDDVSSKPWQLPPTNGSAPAFPHFPRHPAPRDPLPPRVELIISLPGGKSCLGSRSRKVWAQTLLPACTGPFNPDVASQPPGHAPLPAWGGPASACRPGVVTCHDCDCVASSAWIVSSLLRGQTPSRASEPRPECPPLRGSGSLLILSVPLPVSSWVCSERLVTLSW